MPTKPAKSGSFSTTAVSYVTQGTYQREIEALSGQAWTSGTEFELETVSDNIVAATANKDELFSWVRGNYIVSISGTNMVYEWMIIRMDSADALPDLNSSSVVEALQKDKRIFARGFEYISNTTYQTPRRIKFELYNVKLRYGEELRLVIRPLSTTADAGIVNGLFEWRQVGQ